MKIVLIGTGNVAFHLGPVLKRKGNKIIQLYGRSEKNCLTLAKKLKCSFTTNYSKILPDADLYIVALRDEAIAPFLKNLNFIPAFIVHTSGAVGLDVFPQKMKNTGVIYPLQTFSKSSNKDPETIPFCIEGSNQKSLMILKKLSSTLSKKVFKINSKNRAQIHLAAVFANNFSNYLFVLAEKILNKNKIPFEILKPLILETAQKVQTNTPGKMQTGPAVRGDVTVIKKHLKLLKNFPQMMEIYKLLNKSIEKEHQQKH